MSRSSTMNSILAAALALGVSGAALAQTGQTMPQARPQAQPQTQTQPQTQPQSPSQTQTQADSQMRDPAMQQRMDEYRSARMAMKKAQRAMMIDRHIAKVRQTLELTSEQQALFKPVEDAIRAMSDMPAPRMAGPMATPDQRLRAMAERMRARADGMTKLADAIGPFRNSLTDQQKQRLDTLHRSMMGHGPMMGGMMMGGGMMGQGMGEGMMMGHRMGMGHHHMMHEGWGGQGGYGGGYGGGCGDLGYGCRFGGQGGAQGGYGMGGYGQRGYGMGWRDMDGDGRPDWRGQSWGQGQSDWRGADMGGDRLGQSMDQSSDDSAHHPDQDDDDDNN